MAAFPEVHVVDAFTDRAFHGNPAGVVVLTEPAPEPWMRAVAAEMRHSETAFVVVGGDGPLPLRWFTPVAEVDLCGHATLATAHVLGGDHEFATRSGVLRCRALDGGAIELDLPIDSLVPVEPDSGLLAGLPGMTISAAARGREDYLVRVASADEVRALRPDFAELTRDSSRGVIVTAIGEESADFVSRCFYPAVGVDEDPVTGSAHCTLAAYWSVELGRSSLVGHQLSARGGVVETTVDGDRVRLRGRAVTVLTGRLTASTDFDGDLGE